MLFICYEALPYISGRGIGVYYLKWDRNENLGVMMINNNEYIAKIARKCVL